MVITVKYKKKTLPLEYALQGAGNVKLYEVPAAYSDDGFCACVWGYNDMEPVPGCAVDDTVLLAHFKIHDESAAVRVAAAFLAKGVSYAD